VLIGRGVALVESFLDRRPEDVDEVLLNEVLDACCRLGDIRRLEATRKRMDSLGVAPSSVTLGVLVKAYGKQRMLEKVLQVWDEMEVQRSEGSMVTYCCMVEACIRCRHLGKALELFDELRSNGRHRNTILYCTLIKGYGLEKDHINAMRLFRDMQMEGVPYNTVTYNTMLDVCVNCDNVAMAEALVCEMTAPGSVAEPDLVSFSTLLKGYCSEGHIEKALQVMEAIKARGLHCDELVYNTLIDACTRADDLSAAIGLFEEMVHSNVCPSSNTYRLLEVIYRRAGFHHLAQEAVIQLSRDFDTGRLSSTAEHQPRTQAAVPKPDHNHRQVRCSPIFGSNLNAEAQFGGRSALAPVVDSLMPSRQVGAGQVFLLMPMCASTQHGPIYANLPPAQLLQQMVGNGVPAGNFSGALHPGAQVWGHVGGNRAGAILIP